LKPPPVMLLATLLNATWILLQVVNAFSPLDSLGLATAASACENFPTTSLYANWRRYCPLGRWLAILATTDARCLTAASKDRTCGAVDNFLLYLTPRSLMLLLGEIEFPSTIMVMSATLPALEKRSICVFNAFIERPILHVLFTKRAVFSLTFLITSSTLFPDCHTLESSAWTRFSPSPMPRYSAMPLTRMMKVVGHLLAEDKNCQTI
jgi:hypothetical protein